MAAFRNERHMMHCMSMVQGFFSCWHPDVIHEEALVRRAYFKVLECLKELHGMGVFPDDVSGKKWEYLKNTLNAIGMGSINTHETRTKKYLQLLEDSDEVGTRISGASYCIPS